MAYCTNRKGSSYVNSSGAANTLGAIILPSSHGVCCPFCASPPTPPLLAPRKLALFSHYAQTNIHLELYVAFVLASSPSQTTPTRQHLGCLTWLPQSWWNVCLIVLQPLSYFCLPTTTLLGLGRLFLSTTIPQLYLSPPAGLVSKDGGGASLLHRLLENDVKKKMIKWMAVIHWTESVLQMMSIFFYGW